MLVIRELPPELDRGSTHPLEYEVYTWAKTWVRYKPIAFRVISQYVRSNLSRSELDVTVACALGMLLLVRGDPIPLEGLAPRGILFLRCSPPVCRSY